MNSQGLFFPFDNVFIFPFDKENVETWDSNPEYNRLFLRSTYQACQNLLAARGHLMLNDVLDMFGIKQLFPDGFVQGWLAENGDPGTMMWLGDDNTLNFKTQGSVVDKI